MGKPFEVQAAELSLAIAGLQDELAVIWDKTLGFLVDSKFRDWAAERRKFAYEVLQRWPVSMGGTVPDENWNSARAAGEGS